MSHPLDGPRAKIERANKHIDELESGITEFFDGNPHSFVEYVDAQTGEWVCSAVTNADPPARLSVIIGDVAHNLRSALDLLVWQLVISNGETPTKDTKFPTSTNAKGFKSGVDGQVKGASKDAQDLILATKAYKGGDGEFLWVLNCLNIRDKHNILVTVGNVLVRVLSSPDRATWATRWKPAELVFIEDGTEVIRSTTHREDQEQINVTLGISFGKGEILQGEPLIPSLRQLAEAVAEVVELFVPCFDPSHE